MSSEKLASAKDQLKGDLGGSWNALEGSESNYTDLGIARRFGDSAAAYSLRDIGAMNGSVVRVRREPEDTTDGIDDEEKFSANQVQSGALEDWVNGKLESTLPADVATAAAAYSLRRVSEGKTVYESDFSAGTDDIGKNISNQDDVTLTGNVDGISDGSTSKDNVLKVENNATSTPQLKNLDTGYRGATDGIVEFTYYVPTGHPIIGNYWHIGTADGGATPPEVIYSGEGEKIVGGAWTTATIKFGRRYSKFGVDKPDNKYFRFLTILDQRVSDKILENPVTANDGDIYYISDITVKSIKEPLRIRRSSDDIEVDVAFDSDDKVSATSAITNIAEQGGEIGSTTATDLNGFLNNEHTIDFESFSFSRVRFTRTDDQTIGGQIADKFEVNATGSNYYLFNNSFFDTNASGTSLGASQSKQVLTFKYYVDSTESPNVNYFHFRTGAAGNPVAFNEGSIHEIVKDSWQTLTLTLDAGDSVGLRYYVFISNTNSSSNASTMTVGEAFYLQDIPITYSEVTAFVNTWYDQAGSNNAVQETDANQPKIAENGALLADGVSFNGDFFLQKITTDTTTAASIFGVHTKGTTNGSGVRPMGHQESTSAGTNSLAFAMDNSIRFDGTAATTSTQTIPTSGLFLATTIKVSNTEANNFLNSVSNIADNSLTLNDTDVRFTLGFASTTPDYSYDGNIKEAIFYNSDQSDNRFKIESNINNYYGLYNDANDMLTDWSDDPTAPYGSAFTSNGKDGYTVDYSAGVASTRARWQFENNVASGDTIYYSFNASITSGTPSIITKQANGTSNAQSNAVAISNGFNSGSITTNAEAVYFAIGDTEGTQNFTISDFKISLIARDGLVETWYDQSGSGNNATQGTADQQPKIVSNGGIVKNVKGFPSLKFEFTPRTELDIGLLISNLNSVSAYVVTQKDDGDTNVMAGFTQGVSGDNSRFYLPFYTDGTTPNLGYNNSASKISFGTTLTGTCNLYSVFSGDTNIEAFKNGSSAGTTALVDQAVTATDSKIGQLSNSFYLDGVISEIFLTTQKLQDDAATINSNVTSYYNL